MPSPAVKSLGLLNWWLPLLIGIAAAVGVHTWIEDRNDSVLRAETYRLSTEIESRVRERLGLFEYGLRGARGAIITAPGNGYNRKSFENYSRTRDVAREFSGALGFGFIRRVPQAEEADFLARARADGAPNFSIRSLSPNDGERFVIQYIYPTAGNEQATGLDIASEANRRAAAVAAARSGQPQLTGPITLVQADGKLRRGLLILLPIYPPGAPVLTPEDRERAVMGWSYAPLVVGDVLLDLGRVMDQVTLTLTHRSEESPFFSSSLETRDQSSSIRVEREIFVMGQTWRMQVQPRPALATSLNLISPWWAVWFGLGAMLGAILLTRALQGYRTRSEGTDGVQAGGDGLNAFLQSPDARQIWIPVAGVMVILLTALTWQLWQSELRAVSERLTLAQKNAIAALAETQSSFLRDVQFLASTPPIATLSGLLPANSDLADDRSAQEWKERLAIIFTAYLHANPGAMQVRLIAADTGREVVKMVRSGGQLLRVPEEALQYKGQSSYVTEAVKLAAGSVYISDINLNVENGIVERPVRPTWRFATPVYTAQGNVFGVMVINADAASMLRRVAAAAALPDEIYVIDSNQNFLVHKETSRTFGSDLGQTYGWEQEFSALSPLFGFDSFSLDWWRHPTGDVWASQASFQLQGRTEGSGLQVLATTRPSAVVQAVVEPVVTMLVVLLSFFTLGAGAHYLAWIKHRQRLREQELAKVERLQSRENALLKGLIDSAPEATLVVDTSGVIQLVNTQAEKVFGYSRAELLAHSVNKLLPLGVANTHTVHLAQFARGPHLRAMGAGLELRARRSDGSEFPVEVSLGPVKVEDGLLTIASVRDVSEQKSAEQALQAAKDRLALALNSTGMGVWEYDVKANTVRWDDNMYALYGVSRSSDVEPYSLWQRHIHPEDRERAEAAVAEALAGGRPFDPQFRIVRPDGSVRTLQSASVLVRSPQGEPLTMIGVNRDITELAETAANLEVREKLLLRVGRLAKIGGWRVDLESGSVQWSEQTRLIHEVPPDFTPTLASGIEFYAPEHRELIHQAVDAAIETGQGWDLELRLITYTGRSIWVRAQGEAEFENGEPVRLVGAFQDVTERREATEILRAAKQAAEAATLAKSSFLANTSHEIRTPLNAIIGLSHLLSEDRLSEHQLSLVKKIQLSGRSLLGIVNDVLDLSKIEADEMTVEAQPCQLPDLLEEVAGVFTPQAELKGLQLKLQISEDVPILVVTDALRLRQILTNLLGNALKFTTIGGIDLNAQVLPPEAGQLSDRVLVRFSVRDTGIGISEEAQRELFQPFSQADASTTRRYGGTGLGLSIVSKLAALLGGSVGVDSAEGVGSTFWVNLPLRMPTEQELMDFDESTAGLYLMLAEDNPDDAAHLKQMAQALGWRIHAEGNGADLVQAYMERHSRGLRMPDALLVDWQMPEMDGLQAIQELAKKAVGSKLPAVLVITAFEQERIKELDKEGLVDRVLHKPVEASLLFNAVNDVVVSHTGNPSRVLQATKTEAVKARWLPEVRVLVVDDSEMNLDVVGELLRRNGALVTTAASGEEALDKLSAAPGSFDAVLMDVQMPGIDGLEATRRARKLAGIGKLPIIALTAGALREERRRALDAGMDDFLTKPIDPSQLISRLRIAVEGYRGVSLPIESLAAQEAQSGDAWTEIDGLNLDQAKRLLSGDLKLFLTTLERLLSEHINLQSAPSVDVDAPDSEALRLKLAAQVHKLRSASGMVGAERMHALASRAEVTLRAPGEKAETLLRELAESLKDLERHSAPVLDSWREARAASELAASASGAGDADGAKPLATADLQQLQQLLLANDLSAQDWVDEHAASLRQALGPEAFANLQKSMANLDYRSALDAVNALANTLSNALTRE